MVTHDPVKKGELPSMEVSFVRTQPAFVCAPPQRYGDSLTLEAARLTDGAAVRGTVTPSGMTAAQIDRLLEADQPVGNGSMVELCFGAGDRLLEVRPLFVPRLKGLGLLNFASRAYGPTLSPTAEGPGRAVASGWLTGQGEGWLSVGDLDLFQETYALSPALTICTFHTDTGVLTVLPGNPPPLRPHQQVIAVFGQGEDRNRVTQLYYITPIPPIPSQYLRPARHLPDGSPLCQEGGRAKPETAVWLTAVRPFAVIPGRLYYVGDNEVALYLLRADDGTLLLLDAGWPAGGYQYWRNIAALGFDPGSIRWLLLSHGHFDHYGTAAELAGMVERKGGRLTVCLSREDAHGLSAWGHPERGGILKDRPTLDLVSRSYEDGGWLEFGGVRIQTILTPGHTDGTVSFRLELTVPATGEVLTFAYLGGYGINGLTRREPDTPGYLRLAFQYGLRYLQQTVEPDYLLPQHTNQYPLLELQYLAEQAGLPLLSVLVRGGTEWVNFLEKRQAALTYEGDYQRWLSARRQGTSLSPITDQQLETIEAAGPFRRPAGTYTITLTDAGKALRGFDRALNRTAALAELKDGLALELDSYVHDPDGWYVQVGARVHDSYSGECAGGPVERVHRDWFEILRTVRLNSRAEAQGLLSGLRAGRSYQVALDQSGQILPGRPLQDTFHPVSGVI